MLWIAFMQPIGYPEMYDSIPDKGKPFGIGQSFSVLRSFYTWTCGVLAENP
jgi:hypothetical protein